MSEVHLQTPKIPHQVIKCRVFREFIETPDIVGKDKHKEFDFGRR
jgi:hypothetical protein